MSITRTTRTASALLDPISFADRDRSDSGPLPSEVSPLPHAAIALAAGIYLGDVLHGPEHWLWFGLAAWSIAICLCLRARRPWTRPLIGLALTLGVLLGATQPPPLGPDPTIRDAVIAVDGVGQNSRDRTRAPGRLICDDGCADTPVRLRWKTKDIQLAAGETVRARVRIRGPRSLTIPGEFPQQRLLQSRGELATVDILEVRQELDSAPILGPLDRHRARSRALLLENADEHGISAAIALGEGGAVSMDSRELFGRSGLAHVLAVSGLHFGLVALAIFGSVRWLVARLSWATRNVGGARIAAALTLPVLALYVVYVGAPVSARRAFVMAACLLAGRILDRRGHPLISLSLAALILLIAQPGELFGVGFQLSFSAVIGLLWTARYWEQPTTEWLERQVGPRWLRGPVTWIWSALISTAGASVATTPFVIAHFGWVPLSGGLANLWAIPMISFLSLPLAGLAALLTDLAPGLAATLAELGGWATERLVESVAWFDARAPLVGMDVRPQPTGAIVAWSIWALATLWGPRYRLARVAWLLTTIGLALWHSGGDRVLEARDGGDNLAVTFLAVGQGDATLIELPGGGTMLIDAGGIPGSSFDVGERVVVPALREMGHERIDILVLTHPDWDHMGGMPSVMRALKPRELWTNGDALRSRGWRELVEAAAETGVRHRVVSGATPPFEVGGVRFEVLWPAPFDPERDRNDNSIVLRLDHGKLSFLLTGDAEEGAETALLAADRVAPATVLKAGHHGSKTSSSAEFLDRVGAHWMVYSVGPDNKFGFPHRPVQERAQERNMRELRTDYDGSIRFESDGERLRVLRYQP